NATGPPSPSPATIYIGELWQTRRSQGPNKEPPRLPRSSLTVSRRSLVVSSRASVVFDNVSPTVPVTSSTRSVTAWPVPFTVSVRSPEVSAPVTVFRASPTAVPVWSSASTTVPVSEPARLPTVSSVPPVASTVSSIRSPPPELELGGVEVGGGVAATDDVTGASPLAVGGEASGSSVEIGRAHV